MRADEEDEDAIDAVLIESFPASDAPPWTLGLDPRSGYLRSSADEPVLSGDDSRPSDERRRRA